MTLKKVEVTIDGHELACRIAEACIGVKRPEGMTPKQALNQLKNSTDSETVERFYGASTLALEYVMECLNSGIEVKG